MGSSQVAKASVFEADIGGSIPSSPAKQVEMIAWLKHKSSIELEQLRHATKLLLGEIPKWDWWRQSIALLKHKSMLGVLFFDAVAE